MRHRFEVLEFHFGGLSTVPRTVTCTHCGLTYKYPAKKSVSISCECKDEDLVLFKLKGQPWDL